MAVVEHEIHLIGIQRSGIHALQAWLVGHFRGPVAWVNHAQPGGSPLPTRLFHASADHLERDRSGLLQPKEAYLVGWENLEPAGFRAAHASFREKIEARLPAGESFARHTAFLLLLRDPFNQAASLLRCDRAKLSHLEVLWEAYAQEFLRETRHVPDEGLVPVRYDLWFSSAEYRRALARRLGLAFSDANLNEVWHYGGGSSFDGLRYRHAAQHMRVGDRWRAYRFDPDFRRALDRPGLLGLSQRIFGTHPAEACLAGPRSARERRVARRLDERNRRAEGGAQVEAGRATRARASLAEARMRLSRALRERPALLFSPENRRLSRELVRASFRVSDHNSVLGVLWSLLGPLAMLVVLYAVFHGRFGRGIEGYGIYLMVGIVSVSFFNLTTTALLRGFSVHKLSFLNSTMPRETFLATNVFLHLYKFVIQLGFCAALAAASGLLSWHFPLLLLPLLASYTAFCTGVGLVLALVFSVVRDVEHIWTIACRLLLFVTPVFYTLDDISSAVSTLVYWGNPLTPFLVAFRGVTMGAPGLDPHVYAHACTLGLASFAPAYAAFLLYHHRAAERA